MKIYHISWLNLNLNGSRLHLNTKGVFILHYLNDCSKTFFSALNYFESPLADGTTLYGQSVLLGGKLVTWYNIWHIPGWHVIFREERNFENFGAGHDYFLAGCGYGFSGDPVHLVEGVWPQVTVICCSNEHLQVDRLLTVANKLARQSWRDRKTACKSEVWESK